MSYSSAIPIAVQTSTTTSHLSWRRQLREEDGLAMSITVITMAFAMLALVLIFLPAIENYTSRRFAQNGVDAAAHAGAGKIADDLSISYGTFISTPYVELTMAFCPSIPVPTLNQVRDQARRRAVELYQLYSLGYVNASGAGRAEASRFASANGDNLRNYSQQVSLTYSNFNFQHRPTNKTLYPVYVDAEATRTFKAWTNQSFDVPAFAGGIAYITKVDAVVDMPVPHPFRLDPVTKAPCLTWMVMYKYTWEIALVRRQSSLFGLFP